MGDDGTLPEREGNWNEFLNLVNQKRSEVNYFAFVLI